MESKGSSPQKNSKSAGSGEKAFLLAQPCICGDVLQPSEISWIEKEGNGHLVRCFSANRDFGTKENLGFLQKLEGRFYGKYPPTPTNFLNGFYCRNGED